MSSSNKGRLYTLGAALLWGLAGVCVKSITWSSVSLMAFRSLVSLLMLFAIRKSKKIRFSKENILGGISTSLTGVLYMQAIKLTTAGAAIVLQYIAPILVFLYAVIFQHRKAKLYEAVLTLLVFSGIAFCFADSLDPSMLLGNLLGIISGFTFAAQIIFMASENADSDDCLIIGNLISFVCFLPFMFFDKGLSFSKQNIVWVLILSVFQYGLANIFFSRGIRLIDKVESTVILTIEPIFNPIPVAIICGEMMGLKAITGSVIVIICVTLYGLIPSIIEKRKANS